MGTGKQERTIASLRDLPRDIKPPRDLWQGIEARLEPRSALEGETAKPARAQWTRRPQTLRWLAAAAMIAAVAVGIWIGRSVLPTAGKPTGTAITAANSGAPPTVAPVLNTPEALHAAFVADPRYVRDRAALVKSLEAQLASLPPESRDKVMASLRTIQDSIHDLEAALGKDPTNALLQELLVNTYQDEMRVLMAVHEAGDAGKGI
jgi:hypothetical protein